MTCLRLTWGSGRRCTARRTRGACLPACLRAVAPTLAHTQQPTHTPAPKPASSPPPSSPTNPCPTTLMRAARRLQLKMALKLRDEYSSVMHLDAPAAAPRAGPGKWQQRGWAVTWMGLGVDCRGPSPIHWGVSQSATISGGLQQRDRAPKPASFTSTRARRWLTDWCCWLPPCAAPVQGGKAGANGAAGGAGYTGRDMVTAPARPQQPASTALALAGSSTGSQGEG